MGSCAGSRSLRPTRRTPASSACRRPTRSRSRRSCARSSPAVRDARPGDAAALAALVADLGDDGDAGRLAAALHTLGADERVLVADEDGAVRGFASAAVVPFFHDGSRRLRLTAVAVAAPYRGRGIARSLVRELERWGRDRGCTLVEVTSAEHRSDAHAAYRALGFDETSRRFVRQL